MKITKTQIKEISDSRSWERGLNYHNCGNVLSILEDENMIIGKVQGTHKYNVKLWLEDGELDGSCDCPMGDAGVFCKHCIATALTYIEGEVDSAKSHSQSKQSKKSRPSITIKDIRKYLSSQEPKKLVELIIKQMMNDDRLQQQLMLKTARFNQKGVDIEIFKAMINQATNTGGFVDYSEAYDFAEGISNVIDNIEELLKEGFANEVIELTEYAMIRIEEALGEMDDSDGYMSDMLDRLEEIHYKACKKAAPDPETLARCLFTWEINTNWDTFYGAVDTYADVLGDKGLAVYRKLAEAEWSKLPELEPGQTEGRYFSERHRLNSIMETLAVLDNDTEALVAVKKKDLSYAYHFLEIAQIYKDAEDKEKALEWAERGLKAFPKNTDSRLREFLADEYHSRKRHDEAMQLIWLNFIEHPGLENYKSLKQHAERVIEWSKWRQESLEYIRSAAAGEQKSKTSAQLYRNESWYNSMLVRIFLWEKDIESAWLEAKKGGCHNDLWMELARLREKSHPEDAIEIYKNQVVSLVQRTNNQAYREAIILIKNIRKLMNSLKKVEEFSVYVSFLKSNYKPKRNFMKLLDKLR